MEATEKAQAEVNAERAAEAELASEILGTAKPAKEEASRSGRRCQRVRRDPEGGIAHAYRSTARMPLLIIWVSCACVWCASWFPLFIAMCVFYMATPTIIQFMCLPVADYLPKGDDGLVVLNVLDVFGSFTIRFAKRLRCGRPLSHACLLFCGRFSRSSCRP